MLGNWFQSSMPLWVKKLLLMVVLVFRLVSLVQSSDWLPRGLGKQIGKERKKSRKSIKPSFLFFNFTKFFFTSGETSIEPSYDCVRGIIKDFGFEIMVREMF